MTVKEITKADRFEAAFNRIHQKLKDLRHQSGTDQFTPLLRQVSVRHNIVRQYQDKLEQYAKLRNALVHEKIKPDYYIADPHQQVVEDIEMISELLIKPPLATKVSSAPVLSFERNTPIREILEAISINGYSQFPIYENGEFAGLLTEGGVAKWFSNNIESDLISIENITAEDILEVEKPHNVCFLPRKTTIFELEDVFEEAFDENKKLEAVLLTENGKENQSPLGIITSWDLVQIDHTTISLSSQV